MATRQNGFTTLELLVTLAVLGIVAVLSIPPIQHAMDLLGIGRSRGAAEQVASAIQQTRSYAIMHSCTYRVTLTAGPPGTFSIAPVGGANNCAPSGPTEGPTEIAHLAAVSASTVDFDSVGSATAVTILVNSGQPSQRTITVNAAGQVRVTPQ
jgi:prepilin-type N-terminal cleavage/methylation domain-containing protein